MQNNSRYPKWLACARGRTRRAANHVNARANWDHGGAATRPLLLVNAPTDNGGPGGTPRVPAGTPTCRR
eukprot:11211850-Lingulodinium_polyedra.AAC.1